MRETHCAASCRWAQPTLFLESRLWLESWDRPWTCMRDGTPRTLESTEPCATCSRWEARTPGDVQFGDTCVHRRVPPFFLDLFARP